MKQKILIIVTGGLIIQEYDEKLGYVPQKNLSAIVDTINSENNMETIELCEFSTVDSSAIDLGLMHSLAKLVQRKVNHDSIKGVVIIAGSDTMEILAYFLHRCIFSHLKPIVITGAMKHLTESDFDGKANLTNAIKQVANPEAIIHGYGVTINFAGKIHSPIHVTKDHSFAVDPFTSGNYGLIGLFAKNTFIVHYWNYTSKCCCYCFSHLYCNVVVFF
jgi:L-asparaginase